MSAPGPDDPFLDQPRRRWRSVSVGIAGTILFHLLFLFSAPRWFFRTPDAAAHRGYDIPVQLQADETVEEDTGIPDYVETNPDAPTNVPDDTTDVSGRDQQAANEKKPEELSPDRTPAREGEEDVPFEKVMSGELNPPPLPLPTAPPPAPEVEASEPSEESNPAARDPLPGYDETQGDAPDGVGSSINPPGAHPMPVPEKTEGDEEESEDTQPQSVYVPAQPQHPAPAPRPRLPRITPGPVKRQDAGVSQTGRIGVNARFSQYGEYMERMVEAVSQHWHRLCAVPGFSERSTHVVVEFKLTREGKVKDMKILDTTAQALGILYCRTAIEQGQPYGEWTEDMVQVLGEEQTVTFSFYYW